MQASVHDYPPKFRDPETGFTPRSFLNGLRDKFFFKPAPSSSDAQNTYHLVPFETNDGIVISQEMRATLWLELEKNIQYAMGRTQTEIYHTPERLWKDLLPFVTKPSRPNPAKLAVDRMTAASVELCKIVRSTASFVFRVYDILSEAVVLFECTSRRSADMWRSDLVNLSEQITRQLDFSGCLEEKLEQTINDLKRIQLETNRQFQLCGAAANRHASAAGVCLTLMKISSGLGMVMALGLGIERSAAATGIIGLSTFDKTIVAGSGILAATSSVCGSGAKAAIAWKKVKEETYGTLESTFELTTDTIHAATHYTSNFQRLRAELANAESMLFDGGELVAILDRFKHLRFIFGQLRDEGILSREFLDHYKLPVGCYTEEGLLEPPRSGLVEAPTAPSSLSKLIFKPYPFLSDSRTSDP
ncbi:hypothetical protein FRB95_010592 [Tulasnella sp. JGI-2019a]|nr:hypothetical protein FRB95_010592 [Tulasnella sp. JGI-2019a]